MVRFIPNIDICRKEAEQGDVERQCQLGEFYEVGQDIPQDYAEAMKWYRKAAEQGHADAQYNLGWMYQKGKGVLQDDTAAVKWFHKAAKQGHKNAQYEMDMLCQKDKVVPGDDEDIQILEEEFNDIYCSIQQMLQYRYDDNIENFKTEYNEVYIAFAKLVSGKNSEGDEYLRNFSEEFDIVYPAIEKMVARAQIETDPELIEFKDEFDIVYISIQKILYGIEDEELDEFKEEFYTVYNALEEVLAGKDESTSESLKEFSEEFDIVYPAMKKMVARAKDVNILPIRKRVAQDSKSFSAEHLSNDGPPFDDNQLELFDDVPQDEPDDVKRYRKAAEQGDANAQCQLGWIYYSGKGVLQDYVEAVKWYRKAAEQEDANAQFSLGVMYANGQGVSENNAQAVKWYHKAAEQGNSNAQNNLGWMCQDGKGVPKNDAQAVKWYHKAAEQGQEKAISSLTDMGNKGNSAAQFYLGVMYANGKGVTKSDAEAVKWYRKAAEHGNEKAKQQLEDIEGVEDVFIDNNKGKVENIIAAKANLPIDIIFNNPFRILGLPSNAKETEILKQVNNLRTSIELGKTPKIDMEISCFPSCNRTLKSIEDAQGKIEQSENRFLNSFFWYSNEDSVNQLALDVLSEGKIKKSIALWEKHLDQYIFNQDSFEENNQHEHLKDAIIDGILIPYLEDNYNIDTILYEIPSDSDLRIILEYYATDIMGWHLNSNDYCYAVISDDPVGVDDNGEDMTLNIQISKSSIAELEGKFLTLPEKELSYVKNLMVLYLGLAFKNNDFNLTHFNKSLHYAGRLLHSNESLRQYASSIIGAHYGNDSGERIAKLFVDEILKCIKPLLNDNLSGETFKEIADSFNYFPDYLRKEALRELTNKLTNSPIRDINKKVEETAEKRARNPFKANQYGKELYNNSYDILIRLKDILSVDNLQYQNISDAVADEIESCFLDYFKKNREADNDTDPGEDAINLARQAFSITTNTRIKDRIEGWMPILEKWVEDKPLREREKRAKPYIDNIIEQLKSLPDPDIISPNEIIIADGFLESCRRSLSSLKSVLILNRSSIPPIIFLEQFEDNENKWDLNEEGDFLRKIENGQYILQSKNEKNGHWSWGANHINFGNIDNLDFTIECSINKIEGRDDYGFGINWSWKKEDDQQHYFSFKISGNGFCSINEYKQGASVDGFQWTPSPHLHHGAETNVLTVHRHGDSVSFRINDELILIKDKVIHGNNMIGSGIGIDVGADMTIGVNHLYFCNANIYDFRAIVEYMYLSSAVADRAMDFCIAYANRTNDMERPIVLMNKIRPIDMNPESRKRFTKNEVVLRKNEAIKPLRELEKKAKPHIDNIVKQLKGLPDPDRISPSELIIAESFLDSCTRSLNSLKSVLILNRSSLPSNIFLEQFEDNENKWGLNEGGDFSRKIENGQYILQSKNVKSGHWAWGANHINFGNIDNSDFTIECSINKIEGPDDYGFGIVWSLKKENEQQHYFSFKISGNGLYSINEVKQGVYVDSLKWMMSPHLHHGAETNVLTVHRHGDSVSFCINDELILIKDRVIHGNNMIGSGIGIDVGTDMTIGINHLYFCNANTSDFRPIVEYMYLSSAVADRALDFCIAYANRTNDMERPITLMNKIRPIEMNPESRKRFTKNEIILRRNEAITPPAIKLFKKVKKWLE